MNIVYLLLGGNEGNRIDNLSQASVLIAQELGSIVSASPIYETAAWGNENQANFLNQAIKVNTLSNPTETLHIINHIENTLGRQRKEHWGARTIDIDILYFNDIILNSARLVIPHPELQNRRFALVPLLYIAANLTHPIFAKTTRELLNECADKLEVHLYSDV